MGNIIVIIKNVNLEAEYIYKQVYFTTSEIILIILTKKK